MTTELKQELSELFESFASKESAVSEIAARGYVCAEVEQKRVLFMGINPSYVDESEGNYFYAIPDALAGYPRYFKKFQDLAERSGVGSDWTYMDVLFLRETDQKKVSELIATEVGLDFICRQLRLSMQMMEDLKPDLIVVCNSGAKEFFGINRKENSEIVFGTWMGYDFRFDENFGVDVITGLHQDSIKKGVKTTGLAGTPVLFSSTLTYMDSAGVKRLEWQIRQIMKYYELFFGMKNSSGTGHNSYLDQVIGLLKMYGATNEAKIKSVEHQKYEAASNEFGKEREILAKLAALLLKSNPD